MVERIHVLNTPLDVVDMDLTVAAVQRRIAAPPRSPAYIVALNPEKVLALRANPALCEWFERAFLVVPDGIGVVLAARYLSRKRLRRVAGADLMQRLCAVAAQSGYRVFLFGSSEEVNRAAARELSRRYPGLNIVGRSSGYVASAQMPTLIEEINASQPDLLFVGLGSPRQEDWIRTYLPDLQVRVCQGIGGTLDTIAGTVRRAPSWVQNAGFEWMFRLLRQPTRFGRQLNLLRFLRVALAAKMGADRAVDGSPAAGAALRKRVSSN